MNSTIFTIKIFEKKGNTKLGSVKNTANNANIGANKITEKPLYATNISKLSANNIITSSNYNPPLNRKFKLFLINFYYYSFDSDITPLIHTNFSC